MARRKRNTTSAGVARNTSQLEAFPTSENAKLRQSDNKMAVVSIRLLGETIAWLDKEAARTGDNNRIAGRRRRRYRVTRSEVVQLAIAAYRKSKGKD